MVPRFSLTTVFTFGLCIYGYGLLAVTGFVPGGGFVIGAFTYAGMAVGAVVASTVGLVAAMRRVTTDELSPLLAGGIAFSATVIATIALGPVVPQTSTVIWTVLGQFVLALHFVLGVAAPAEYERELLLGTALSVGVFVLIVQLLTFESSNLASFLFISGLAAIGSLLFGGLLFVLGRQI